jgi:NAD(P)-dependent dehydrogenase (short-subunit alcohol dehydrogenase family)
LDKTDPWAADPTEPEHHRERCGGGVSQREFRSQRRKRRRIVATSVQALVATATSLGEVTGLIHAAGVSPSQASPETILKVDLYGTALVLEEFGKVIANGGSGVVIASQSGHRLPASFHLLS